MLGYNSAFDMSKLTQIWLPDNVSKAMIVLWVHTSMEPAQPADRIRKRRGRRAHEGAIGGGAGEQVHRRLE